MPAGVNAPLNPAGENFPPNTNGNAPGVGTGSLPSKSGGYGLGNVDWAKLKAAHPEATVPGQPVDPKLPDWSKTPEGIAAAQDDAARRLLTSEELKAHQVAASRRDSALAAANKRVGQL